MPSGGHRSLRSYQPVVPPFSLSAFVVLLFLLLTDVQGQPGEKKRGSWVKNQTLKKTAGAWLSLESSIHERYDDWSTFFEGMQDWEVAIRVPSISTPKVIDFIESVTSLSVQITPCTSPLNIFIYTPSNQHEFNLAINQQSLINRPTHERGFQYPDQVFYPIFDTRLFGEITSSPEVGPEKMSISIKSTSSGNIPLSESISQHYAIVRLFKKADMLSHDYPAIPKHVEAPRVQFIDNERRAVLHVQLEMENYDNALTRPVRFCIVANIVRPLPQWCSAQIAIPQIKYNRRIWAHEHAWQLASDQYNFTCEKGKFGGSHMSLELSEVMINSRHAAMMNNDEPHSTLIYVNAFIVNEDNWQFASAGITYLLRLPRLRLANQPQIVMDLFENLNLEERMRSVVSTMEGNCSCHLQIPIAFGSISKNHAADVFVISQTSSIKEPIDARVWPYIVPVDHKWQCRASTAERISLLPGIGRWLCRAFTPFNCTANFVACRTILHMVELNAPCLSATANIASLKSNNNIPLRAENLRCPLIKLHVGLRHGKRSTVRHINLTRISAMTLECKKIKKWHSSDDYKEKINCMMQMLRKSLKHQRFTKGQRCNKRSSRICWRLRLVVPRGLGRFPLNPFHFAATNQSIFTFRLVLFDQLQYQANKRACNCQNIQSHKCQLCILNAQPFYLNNSQMQCALPSCQQTQSFEEAKKGVIVKMKRRRGLPRSRSKRHRRNVVLFQLFVAPKNNTCVHQVTNFHVNSCIDAATLVALKSVKEPN